MVKLPRTLTASTVILIIGMTPCAAGQSINEAPRIEVWGGLSAALTGSSGTLSSSYSPPGWSSALINTAAQTLTIDNHPSWGFEGGANVFLSRHAGFQIVVDRLSRSVSGRNSPYERTLMYLHFVTPQSVGIPETIKGSVPWPDTTGSLTQWVTALNGVARLGPRGRVSATLSGGLSVHRLSGEAQPLAYTSYYVEPHIGRDIVSPVDRSLTLALDATNALGFNGGGDISIAVQKHLAVMVGFRYWGGSAIDLPSRVETITEPSFARGTPPVAEDLQTPPARGFSTSVSTVLVGLKWMR